MNRTAPHEDFLMKKGIVFLILLILTFCSVAEQYLAGIPFDSCNLSPHLYDPHAMQRDSIQWASGKGRLRRAHNLSGNDSDREERYDAPCCPGRQSD
jgi:hypothetical protein